MRIAFFIKMMSMRGGGAERVLAEVASELARRGHAVEVVSFDPARAPDFYRASPEVRRARYPDGTNGEATSPAALLRRARRMRAYFKANRPDVAVGFMHSSYVPLALASLGNPVPLMGSEQTSSNHYRGRIAELSLMRLLGLHLDALTATSESVREGFPADLRRRMVVIANPVSSIPATSGPCRVSR